MSEPQTPDKTSKPTTCPACVAGPIGIDGHEKLRVLAMNNSAMRFDCRECHTQWSRVKHGPEGYAWEKVDPQEVAGRKKGAGTAVPGR